MQISRNQLRKRNSPPPGLRTPSTTSIESDCLLGSQVVLGDLSRPARWTRVIQRLNRRATMAALKYGLPARMVQELGHCLEHMKG